VGSANLARILTETAAREPEHVAVRFEDATMSYRELDEASARVAALLRSRGIGAGERVGIMLPNVPYFPVVYFGALRAGCVLVPMNVMLKGRETTFYLSDPEARAVFAWHEFAESAGIGADAAGAELLEVAPGDFERLLGDHEPIWELPDVRGDDTAVILYTSGTTGTPKGAELTHDNLYINAKVVAETLLHTGPEDVVLGALPLFHAFGQTDAMNAAIYVGATLTLLPRFEPGKALEALQRDRVTVFMGVPTMYSAVLHHPDRDRVDTSSLRLCVSGGAALPVEVLHGFEAQFGCKILEGYGLSETSPTASFNHPDRERKPGSIGTAIAGVEMKLGDDAGNEVPPGEVGQIWIRGHCVMKGYWGRPDATAEVFRDGWFATGDIARLDEDGYFYIVDRKKDMIIRGGYNVYPREIEEVIYEHPAVRECAVIGIPHSSLGEEVAAVVATKPGQDLDLDELRAFVKERVAGYKYPRVISLTDELPKGPTGKILKREIKPPEHES